MAKTAQLNAINNGVAHYRLVTALAAQQLAYPLCGLDTRINDDGVDLSSVAKVMQVLAVISTYPGSDGMQKFAAYGFASSANVGPFAAACNRLCAERALVVPDIAAHAMLGAFTGLFDMVDTRFLVGISLQNNRGQRVGSLAVINSSKAVAGRGISFKTLMALGKAFAETGRMHSDLITP